MFVCSECESSNFVQEGKKFCCKDCGYSIDLSNERVIEVTKNGKVLWYEFTGVFETIKIEKVKKET